jgi:hypothetical protein
MFDTGFKYAEDGDEEEDSIFLMWYEYINYHG